MFYLNRAIENWKSELEQNEAFGKDDIMELESHLYEQTDDLTKLGLSEKEAFMVAQSRLGSPEQLGDQFKKAAPALLWKRRFFWMAIGTFGWFTIVLFHRMISAITIVAAVHSGVRSGTKLGIADIAAGLVSLLLILVGCRQLYRHGISEALNAEFEKWTTGARAGLCTIGLLLAGMAGKLLLAAPMIYAADVVPIQEMGRYTVYRTISGHLATAILTVAVTAFVFTQIARHRRPA